MARVAARRSSGEVSTRSRRYSFEPADPAPAHGLQGMGTHPLIIVAEVLVTIMVIAALWLFYGSYWTNIQANRAQAAVTDSVDSIWEQAQSTATDSVPGMVDPRVGDAWLDTQVGRVAAGTPLMKMYIPRLGGDWSYTVVHGVDNASLNTGPGLYTSTQLPGEHGNTAIAGHRDGNGAPFFHLDQMQTCDPIVIETPDNFYIYRVLPVDAVDPGADPATRQAQQERRLAEASACMDSHTAAIMSGTSMGIGNTDGYDYSSVSGRHITTPEDNSVIAPMPSNTSVPPEQAGVNVLTLTTCNPLYFNHERLITHAVLERVEAALPGHVPAEMADTPIGQQVAQASAGEEMPVEYVGEGKMPGSTPR